MNEITLRMPNSLYRNLENLAKKEMIPMNQYILYLLTRQVSQDYAVRVIPEAEVAEQKASFDRLLEKLGNDSHANPETILDEREPIDPEPNLSPETIQKIKSMIAEKKGRKD